MTKVKPQTFQSLDLAHLAGGLIAQFEQWRSAPAPWRMLDYKARIRDMERCLNLAERIITGLQPVLSTTVLIQYKRALLDAERDIALMRESLP